MKFEFEMYRPESELPEIIILELASNAEAETTAYNWLREQRAKIYGSLRVDMTKPEKKEILSQLPYFHVNISGVLITRNEFGEIELYDRRRSR